MLPNDPKLSHGEEMPVERGEDNQVSQECPSAKRSRRWLQRGVRPPVQKTISYQNSQLEAVVRVLKSARVGFPSLGALFRHLEKYPKVLHQFDEISLGSLKPLLVQWQEASRPETTWKESSESFGVHIQSSYYDLVDLPYNSEPDVSDEIIEYCIKWPNVES